MWVCMCMWSMCMWVDGACGPPEAGTRTAHVPGAPVGGKGWEAKAALCRLWPRRHSTRTRTYGTRTYGTAAALYDMRVGRTCQHRLALDRLWLDDPLHARLGVVVGIWP